MESYWVVVWFVASLLSIVAAGSFGFWCGRTFTIAQMLLSAETRKPRQIDEDWYYVVPRRRHRRLVNARRRLKNILGD
jgi:hypothetical protein